MSSEDVQQEADFSIDTANYGTLMLYNRTGGSSYDWNRNLTHEEYTKIREMLDEIDNIVRLGEGGMT